MAKRSMRVFASLLIVLFVFFSFGIGSTASPSAEAIPCFASCGTTRTTALGRTSRTQKTAAQKNLSTIRLYPGGMPFGVKFMTEGILVVGFCELQDTGASQNPAIAAGLRQGDTILRASGKLLTSAADLNEQIEKANGAAVSLRYCRDGKEYETSLTPVYSPVEGRYKSGIYVRDSGAGIGTVTFIVPETLAFGGLGHGICDADTGELIPIQRGSVVGVKINGVVKGLAGSPGEVKGYFSSGKIGSLLENSECGVFGVFGKLPSAMQHEPLPIGTRHDLQEGTAHIYCTLDENTAQQYEIEICDIHRDAMSNKCFTIKVTDPRLIDKTGGIIQGMSGSPIIQNGKLVGAVTHVLINDPTTGYGIFLENMLGATSVPMRKAA